MTDLKADENEKPMPLEGVRIVEYAVYHAGPGAGAILGDLGAEVIKIEEGTGDPERFWNTVGGMDLRMSNGESIWFQISNRNKKGICLDIKKEKGREIFHALVREADVFLTNLRKTTKASMGLDYENISRINPQIIHANVSGFGPEGPFSDRGAYDPMGQARSGMMFTTGKDKPALINLGVLDQSTAIAASHAILTALFYKERHGIGQEIHVSLYSTGLWLLYGNMLMMGALSLDPNIEWSRSANSPLRNLFCCKDGNWIIGTHHPEDRYWSVFCEATGRTDLLSDPRFADDAGRIENCPELVAIFDEVFATRTRDEWMDIFREYGLMFSPVQKLNEIFADPQALINDYVVDFEDPVFDKIKIPGYPVHFSKNSAGTRSFGPTIGQHTDQVLRQMGYTDDEIRKLKKEKVIR
jgi:crotonobetainyl-CoA:carnitine CoA-transferase CaiB-like acyl-CoA transferase